jgi:hypothetical protein
LSHCIREDGNDGAHGGTLTKNAASRLPRRAAGTYLYRARAATTRCRTSGPAARYQDLTSQWPENRKRSIRRLRIFLLGSLKKGDRRTGPRVAASRLRVTSARCPRSLKCGSSRRLCCPRSFRARLGRWRTRLSLCRCSTKAAIDASSILGEAIHYGSKKSLAWLFQSRNPPQVCAKVKGDIPNIWQFGPPALTGSRTPHSSAKRRLRRQADACLGPIVAGPLELRCQYFPFRRIGQKIHLCVSLDICWAAVHRSWKSCVKNGPRH